MTTLLQGSWGIAQNLLAAEVVLNEPSESLHNIHSHSSNMLRVDVRVAQDIDDALSLFVGDWVLNRLVGPHLISGQAEDAQNRTSNKNSLHCERLK